MNKQAYFKLMGLQKKAGPVDWIKNKYKDLEAQRQINAANTAAAKQRAAAEATQRAEIAKDVEAAEQKYKQEKAQDAATVAKVKADNAARQQRAIDLARSNKVKAAQEAAATAALTPAQRMQKRLLEQKKRNAQNKALAAFEGAKKNVTAPLETMLTGQPLDRLLEQKGVKLPTPVEERMSKLKQEQANALEAAAVRKGLGDVFMFDRFNKGNMSADAKAALGQNIRKYTTYKDKGWWERLLAWIRQKWAELSGSDPLSTERGSALQAGERAGNIWAGLSDKVQKGLLQGK